MLSQKGYKAFNNDKWLSLRDKENEALKTKNKKDPAWCRRDI